MKNKLGVNEYILEEIEYKLVNTKINMIDNTYTFNNQYFNLKYLIDLNEYLFCDIYDKSNLGIRKIDDEEKQLIEGCLNKIVEICINDSNNIDEIINSIESIWLLQPLVLGNTRTLIAYLKILKESFSLDIEININDHIESKLSTFSRLITVNQKRLTK